MGDPMQEALLSGETVDQEIQDGQMRRPRNAEFDAMKARLAEPVVAAPPMTHAAYSEGLPEPVQAAMKRAPLPSVRPSHFKSNEPLLVVALRPFALEDSGPMSASLTDALSAAHGVAFRTRVLHPAYRAHFGHAGVWDISTVGVTFDKEVTVHGITARGALTGLRIKSLVASLGNRACTDQGMTLKARPIDAGWRSAIVGWVGQPAPRERATVTTRQLGSAGKYGKLVIDTVDLDGDDVPEFLLWAGLAPPVVDIETRWKAVFVNVQGKWLLLAFNQEADCT